MTRMIVAAVFVVLMVMLVVLGMMVMRHGPQSWKWQDCSSKFATLGSVVVGLCNARPFIYCQIAAFYASD